jgi:transcription elongation GreA/GreB family factor
LPPYLNKLGFLRALGLRDNDVALPEVIARLDNLLKLKVGIIVFQKDSSRWGKVESIDGFSASVAIASVTGEGAFAVPLASVLGNALMFEAGPDTLKLSGFQKSSSFSGNDYRSTANAKTLTKISDKVIKEMAFSTLVPAVIKADAFEDWWKSEAARQQQVGGGRRSCEARSLHELNVLLTKEAETHSSIDDEDIEGYVEFFTRLKPAVAMRDDKLLALNISLLVDRGQSAQLRDILEPLKGKVPFWPENLTKAQLPAFEVWGDIQVKHVENLSIATSIIYNDEYMAEYATKLPLRCLNYFCEKVSDHVLFETIGSLRNCSCDILLWIWRNRKKHDPELLQLINIEKVAKALSDDKLPRAWVGAKRELKTQLIDKKDFQQQIIEMALDNISVITSVLHTATFFGSGEQQSLLIKLSRLSPELKEHLESGAGEKLVGQKESQTEMIQPMMTSIKSHKRLIQELKDILNIHIPENRTALKVARAHGDFRENAEYDAAKERRNFLANRRAELENDIMMIQPIDLRKISVEDQVVVGCQIDLEYDSGKVETIYLLGAWDGNPDKNWISYKTRMGEVLMGQKVNAQLKLPNGSECTIREISSLPKEIAEELSVEN